MRAKLKIGLVCLVLGLVLWVCWWLHRELVKAYEQSGALTEPEYSWFFNLLLNVSGYAMIMAPGLILCKYLNTINYFDKIGSGSVVSRLLHLCYGEGTALPEAAAPAAEARAAPELLLCFTGLMASYLVWGLLQEKIMTQEYTVGGAVVRFRDAQLLVLVSRVAALCCAGAVLLHERRALLARPLFPFSYCALSNVVSAWCQYEALNYVSFPTQVLSKSCKVLPVMLMGKLVSRNTYENYEYITAGLISVGMVLFLGGRGGGGSWAAGGGGLALLGLYLGCDSFTASWQAALFVRTRCRPLQMLCAVNVFSCVFTAHALLRIDDTKLALLQHPGFVWDVALLSASSALGQLVIYRTIARFGAVVFSIIMTLRQAVSILLSCLVYGHPVSWGGGAGVALVFVGVLLRLYCAQRRRKRGAAGGRGDT